MDEIKFMSRYLLPSVKNIHNCRFPQIIVEYKSIVSFWSKQKDLFDFFVLK